MHEALPESISSNHSMDQSPDGQQSGRKVYEWLLDFKKKSGKPVYVLASHSHFYMDGIFQHRVLADSRRCSARMDYWNCRRGTICFAAQRERCKSGENERLRIPGGGSWSGPGRSGSL